jgi:hypothetical protein
MLNTIFTNLFLSFHRYPTIIPRTTLTTNEIENKAMNILLVVSAQDLSSEPAWTVDSRFKV